jgi:hypothetical protein
MLCYISYRLRFCTLVTLHRQVIHTLCAGSCAEFPKYTECTTANYGLSCTALVPPPFFFSMKKLNPLIYVQGFVDCSGI